MAAAKNSKQAESQKGPEQPERSSNLHRSPTPQRRLEALIHCFRESGSDEILWQVPLYRCGFKPEELNSVIEDGRQRGFLTEERRGKDCFLRVTAAGLDFGR